MIRPAEIQKKANKEKVRDTQIEKDYILTWILTGVANNEVLSKALAFKGGTVLKKFYFKDYRYSEDLDFTLVDDRLSNDEIQNAFKEVFLYVREEANIPLSMEDFGIHETGNINFYISYVGPLDDYFGIDNSEQAFINGLIKPMEPNAAKGKCLNSDWLAI